MDEALEHYRQMRRIRRTEEVLTELKDKGDVPGSIHLCIGQEAIPVGAAISLTREDYVTATYRGHGWAVAIGVNPADIFAEAMGRRSRLNGGRASSPYFSDAAVNFLGENSIVGAGVPIACGAALSAARAGRGQVSVVSIGDGATNQGGVHEALNMAAVLRLPLIVVVENNVYSEMSRIQDMTRVARLAERAAAYGMPGVTVDGNDVAVVATSVREAVERGRVGGGPSIVEAMTQRLVGHYSGDVQHYRPTGEIENARTDEPLVRLRAAAETTAAYDRIDGEVNEEIARAVDTAYATHVPDPSTLMEHLYA